MLSAQQGFIFCHRTEYLRTTTTQLVRKQHLKILIRFLHPLLRELALTSYPLLHYFRQVLRMSSYSAQRNYSVQTFQKRFRLRNFQNFWQILPNASEKKNASCRSLRSTALQAGKSRVRFPMVSPDFFIDIILPAALWPWD